MGGPIEDLYFMWLCAQVKPQRDSNYNELMKILYSTEFVWMLRGDGHRAEDGFELRDEFLMMNDVEADVDWLESPCSVLEVLITLAGKASFQTSTPLKDWFWHILTNLGLNEFRRVFPQDRRTIEDILNTFIRRDYSYRGDGGLFPLRRTDRDQRQVELWYQLCEYLSDQGLLP